MILVKQHLIDLFFIIIAFISPLTGLFLATILLVVIDTVTGIMKAGKSDIKKVSSKAMRAGLFDKIVSYGSALLIAQLCVYFLDNEIPFPKLVFAAVMYIEIKSFDENMRDLIGFSFFDKVLDKMKPKV